MAAKHDLTTVDGLRQHLITKGHNPESIINLTGGTANYVYRVSYDSGARTVVFKHAAQYLSSNKDFAFDSARLDMEAAILQVIPQCEHKSSSNTHAVRVLNYNSDHKLLCIEDGGQRNLKEAYTDPTLDVRIIAIDLARWLANLHGKTRTTRVEVPTQNLTIGGGDNNPIAVQIYRYSYNNLHLALTKFGHDIALAERVNKEFGSLLEVENECLCHGDFWPGNVLVRSEMSSETGKSSARMTIVDCMGVVCA
jgi:thiamine kinase-like enzyme